MKRPRIKTVTDGQDKRVSYLWAKTQHKNAIELGFFGEALLIDYAIIEDRLKSFIYYSGGMIEKNDPKVKIDNTRFISAFGLNSDKDKNGNPTGTIAIRDISRKTRIIQDVLSRIKEYSGDDSYLLLMKKALGSENEIVELEEKLGQCIEKWVPKRNEIIHGLLNKNTEDLYKKYRGICEEGMKYALFFDNRVRAFKDRANIREFLGLKTENDCRT